MGSFDWIESWNVDKGKVFTDINVLDASKPECDLVLRKIMDDNAHVTKSRVAEYKLLQQRSMDRKTNTVSHEEFLKGCDIHVAVVNLTDNLTYASRIEKLVNRSNQLNFTKTRIPEGTIAEVLSDYYHRFWPR